MFNHPDSWRAFSHSIVRNYTDVLAKDRSADGIFELKKDRIPNAITKFLTQALQLNESTSFRNRISETRIFNGTMAGEYTTLYSEAVHLLLKRKTTGNA